MSQGPSIQGQVVINTKSVDQAITSVKRLETNVTKAFGLGGQAASSFAKTLNQQTSAYSKVSAQSDNYRNIIAKAANTVANYEAAVRKSNVADSQKEALIKQSTASLKGFEQAVIAGARSGQSLKNVTTELNVGLGQLKRDLTGATTAERAKIAAGKELEKTQIRTEKAASVAAQQYERTAAAIRASTMSEAEKAVKLRELDAAHKKLNNTLTKTTSTVRSTSAAQNSYKETLNKLNVATKNTGYSQASKDAKTYSSEMRNLTSSVTVALGPLSGVASRLTALTGLFNRNAASIAIVLASVTALTVLFSKASQAVQEAEKQMLRVNAQLEIMGDRAQVTGADINAMAHSIAASTLLSAQEVREASGALIEFGGVGRSQFADVIKSAKGMSVVFGGNLQGNIRKLGRAIEDPIRGLKRLETVGVILTDSTQKQIKTLSAQGQKMAATSVLLEELASYQAAAESEAKGLAGAYDTLSGNLDKLYEDLFNASGAAVAMTDSVNKVADSVTDFMNSDAGDIIGKMFERAAKLMGTAFDFALRHADALALALTFIAGSVVPKLFKGVGVLALSLGGPLSKAFRAARNGALSTATAMDVAKLATKGLNAAMKSSLVWGVVSGVTALATAIWQYKDAKDAAMKDNKVIADQISRQIQEEIVAREDLTKKDIDGLNERSSLLSQQLKDQEKLRAVSSSASKEALTALRDTIELGAQRGSADYVQEQTFKDLASGMELTSNQTRRLSDDQKALVEDYLRSKNATDNYRDAVQAVKEALEQLRDSVPGVVPSEEISDAVTSFEDLSKSTDDLQAKFLKQEASTKALKEEYDSVTKSMNTLKDLSNNKELSGEQQKVAAQKAEVLRRVLEQIGVKLEGIGNASESKGFTKLVEGIDKANKELEAFKATLGLEGKQEAIAALGIEMKYLTGDVERLVTGMNAAGRANLGDMLGTGGDTSVDALTQAYVAFIQKQKEMQIEMEATNTAGNTLEAHFDGQASSVDKLGRKYLDLQYASIEATGAMSEGVTKWLNKEKEALDRQATRISTTEFTDLDHIQEDYEAKLELLKELQGVEYTQYAEHLDKMKAKAEQQKVYADVGEQIGQASKVAAKGMEVMEAAGQKNTAAYKAMAIAQATMAAGLAIIQTLADPTIPSTTAKIALSAMIGGLAGAQVATIASTNYATGGYVSGPGTSTSDSIPANLSNGEYVLKADAVKKLGMRNLEMLNNGGGSNYSQGGGVGSVAPLGVGAMSGGSTNNGSVNLTVVDNSTGDKDYRTEEGFDQNGNREMRLVIDNAVKDSINRGRYDKEMGNSYGVRRKGRKVS